MDFNYVLDFVLWVFALLYVVMTAFYDIKGNDQKSIKYAVFACMTMLVLQGAL